MLAIIKEHLGHITHSVSRIQTLASELEASLGISLPEYTPYPLPDFRRDPLTTQLDASSAPNHWQSA